METKQLGVAVLVVWLLGGCASAWNIGAPESSCPGVKSGVVCKTPAEVYRLTNSRDSLVVVDAEGNKGEAPGADQAGEASGKAARGGGKTVQLPQPLAQPQPILEPAQVMRIRVSPWIDHNGDLHYPSLLFTEVTPRRWAVGNLVTGASGRVPTAYQVEGADGDEGQSRHSSAVPNFNSQQGGTIPMAPAGITPYSKRSTGPNGNSIANASKAAMSGAVAGARDMIDKVGVPSLGSSLP